MEWKNLYRGFMIGTTDLVPGVSGGTIAIMLGIYHRLLEAISGVFSREWKRHFMFLLPLAAGVVSALLLLSRLIEWLLAHHYEPTQFFFLGLIVGIIPFLLKEVDARNRYQARHYIGIIIGGVVAGCLAFLPSDPSAGPITNPGPLVLLGLFMAGWLASMAMLLPGISGSMVLLLLGVYPTAIYALSNLDLLLIAVIGAGVLLGFISSSKGIRYFLNRFPLMMYAVIIGLVTGSIFVIFPGFASNIWMNFLCLLTFGAGLAISILFRIRRSADHELERVSP